METFNKQISMKGCRLVCNFYGDTTGMYQFVFNPDTLEFSDIYPCGIGLEYDLENDGRYYVITIKNDLAELTEDGKFETGSRSFTVSELANIVLNDVPVNVGDYDVDETISIGNLKKCLLSLQWGAFKDMLKNCGKNKCSSDELRSQRDFLFIAVWLVEHYIELGNIEKAWAVYQSIQGCGNICKNLNKVKCGCNG